MYEDQEAALNYFEEHSANIIKQLRHGVLTFGEALYLLQSDLLEISHGAYTFCEKRGITIEIGG